MDSYIPINEAPRRSRWIPFGVIAFSVTFGAVMGFALGGSERNSSLYTSVNTAPAMTTQVNRIPTSFKTAPTAAYSAPTGEMDEIEYESFPNQEQTGTNWVGLTIIPLAAVAGFMFGARKSVANSVPETFEVVIDDGDSDIAMAATTGSKANLYAVVAIGGHQYLVQPGEVLSIDKLPLEVGDEFAFDKVLLVKDGDKVDLGHPYLSNAKVTAEVIRNSKGRKIRIFKYRAKKHTRLTKGHRQKYTDIHITEVAGHTVPSKVNFAALAGKPADELVKA